MPNIHHMLHIEAPAEKVYDALTTQKGLAGWWTPDTKAIPERDSIARFAFGPTYYKEMKVTDLQPARSVRWLCQTGYEDWIGTTISFDLKRDDKGTLLSLRHDGFPADTEGFARCSYDWALFMRSLRLLCETGKGQPYPNFQ